MFRSAARLLTAILVASAGIYLSLSLALYADRDDAPGGVLIGVILMFGFLALGVWMALRRARQPSQITGK